MPGEDEPPAEAAHPLQPQPRSPVSVLERVVLDGVDDWADQGVRGPGDPVQERLQPPGGGLGQGGHHSPPARHLTVRVEEDEHRPGGPRHPQQPGPSQPQPCRSSD